MKLQRREKILASSAAGVVVLVAGYFLLVAGGSKSTVQLTKDLVDKKDEVKQKEKQLADAERDEQRLADWQRRSLPGDPVLAQSAYMNWLRGRASAARIRDYVVAYRDLVAKKDVYTPLEFTLQGFASLPDFTSFLYSFYSAPHLHQIREMTIKPAANGRDLDIRLTIQALSLAGVSRKDLSKEKAPPLRFSQLADYVGPIAKRNLFSPPAPLGRPKVDPAEFAVVTAFIEDNGQRQVWVQDRMAGKTLKLGEGDTFQIGEASGTVQTIAPNREVILEFDGRRRKFHDGENLRGGVEVREPKPAKEPKEPKPAVEAADAKDVKDAKKPEQAKEPAEAKGVKEAKEPKQLREAAGAKDAKG